MKRKTVLKRIILVLSVIAIFTLAYFLLVLPYKKSVARRTHERIDSYINSNLSYEEDSYDTYLSELNELLELPYITDYDKGHLISYQYI